MQTTQSKWKSRAILFLVSQSVTLFGSTLVQMAIVWYVTLNTSSGVWVAAFSVCSYLPEFLISFFGGVWADRYHRKKLIIGADFLIAIVTLTMMLLMPYIADQSILLWALLFMSILRSLGAGVQTPAVNAVIPQLVPTDQLMRFNGFNATMQSVVRFAAPAAAGVVLTISTLRSTLSIDILTAALGIGLLSCVLIPYERKPIEEASILTDLKAGISYAFSDRLIGRLLIIYGLFIFLCVPAGFLAGLLVSRVYGDTYGYLTLVELVGFAGMMIGGILMSTWGGFKNRKATLLLGIAIFGAMAILMGLSTNFVFYLALMALYGVALTMVQTAITTLLQEKAETSMQGRVFGLLGSMYSGCMPIGMAIFGPLADIIPLQWIMIASGIALISIAIISRFDNQFWSVSMSKEKLSAKRIIIWICVNYGIFILGFFILGSMGTDKLIVWSNFILDVFLVAVSLALNILLFRTKYQAPLLGKIALLLATLCFGTFTYFAFLMPENGLPAVLFY